MLSLEQDLKSESPEQICSHQKQCKEHENSDPVPYVPSALKEIGRLKKETWL